MDSQISSHEQIGQAIQDEAERLIVLQAKLEKLAKKVNQYVQENGCSLELKEKSKKKLEK